MRKSKGFTATEMIIVVIVLGLLVTMALPRYRKAVVRSKASRALPQLKALMDAENIYRMRYNVYVYFTATNGNAGAAWAQLGIDQPRDAYNNYGFMNSAAITVLVYLGSDGAYALAAPYVGAGWGNPNYYETGLSLSGRAMVCYTDGTYEGL